MTLKTQFEHFSYDHNIGNISKEEPFGLAFSP